MARSFKSRRSSVEYSCSLKRDPRFSSPTTSPWLTRGTAILTRAAFRSRTAGESRVSLSISTTVAVLWKKATMGSLGEISTVSTGPSTGPGTMGVAVGLDSRLSPPTNACQIVWSRVVIDIPPPL